MLDNSFFQGDVTNRFEENNNSNNCVFQRCYIPAEYQCPICMKRYCDVHYRVHGHFDGDTSDKDLR
ncbi:MAG: hypothetical protein AB7V56_06620 [Candidatus Nitrosocosmicus sp.]